MMAVSGPGLANYKNIFSELHRDGYLIGIPI